MKQLQLSLKQLGRGWLFGGLAFACLPLSCDDDSSDAAGLVEGECQVTEGSPDFLLTVPCKADFEALASQPVDANLPGARSVKVVLDRLGGDQLYFQNSVKYPIHYEFASAHLSGGDLPVVPTLASFNATEYYTPDRRFVLGAVTYYEGPDAWALELAPYDTASATLIEKVYSAVAAQAYFGPALAFHPTSEALASQVEQLSNVPVVTTRELYAQIDYQPLTLGTTIGRLRFARAAELVDEYLGYDDIVVLDDVPNDISVVAGLITQEFQTPLSHVNVLSQNRGTPNMGLRGALEHPDLVALEGKWVELTVGPSSWSVREATLEEATAFQEAKRPEPLVLPAPDLSVTELLDIEDVTPESEDVPLRDAIQNAITAFGGKAAQYSILAKTEGVPSPPAFGVPIFYYDQFMRENGFYDRLDTLLESSEFTSDPSVRDRELAALRRDILDAPLNEEFEDRLRQKLEEYPMEHTMRFRSSTNSEDLETFACAGCYESRTGDPSDWPTIQSAVRRVWSSIWLFRTFEERSYYGIDHKSVGMALLVHHNFPDEEANGVATTSNIFDPSGLEPAFYVNVQWGGDAEVVSPPPGVSSDQFLYFYYNPNRPITFITHSNLVSEGETVLTTAQTYALGQALDKLHDRFSAAYGPRAGNNGFYAMDVEFKFDDDWSDDGEVKLYVKQARPYPGRNRSD